MGQPSLELTDDGLRIEISKGNKQWVAHITGTHPQYGLDRDFISPRGQGDETVPVEEGMIVEKAWDSHGGKPKGRDYYQVQHGELVLISENHGAHIDDLDPEDILKEEA